MNRAKYLRSAWTWSLALLLFGQCDRPEEALPPAQLLPRDKMVSLLIDVHLTEARVEAARHSPDSANALYRDQAASVFWRHQTNEATFRQSMQYYAIHGKDLQEIYDTVIDSLQARQAGPNPNQWANPPKP